MKVVRPALALALLVLVPGCRPKADQAAKAAPVPVLSAPGGMSPHGDTMGGKKESVVEVPPSQKGKWKAIKISVMDLASKKETAHVVPVATDFVIPGTGLTLRADNLLSDFGMGDGVITSKSDKMANPAVQVHISEGGKEVWKGWMFSLYPDTHAFAHEKFALKLVEFVPAS